MPNSDVLAKHRLFTLVTFGTEKLIGERVYADEKILRILIGPLWNALDPIPAD